MKPPLLPLYDVHQQAAFVGQRVLELSQQENVRLRDIAVLYRAHSHSLELQVELTRRKIPFSVRSGLRFFEQAHVKDVVAYLRLVHNAGDTLAWQRVLKLWSGVGKKSAEKVVGQVSSTRSPAAKALDSADLLKQLPSNARPAIRRLADLLAQIDVEDARPDAVIQTVLDGHYRAYAEGRFSNADIRVEDLEQLADFASRYESLELFLSELAIVAGVAAEAIGPGEMPEERMTLSTIHQAKGLEWRAVFIIGLVEGKFPQAMAARNDAEMEEERRLFHVASTRAMDQLYLCYPRFEETTHGPRRLLRLSRFLSELRSQPIPFERWEIDEVQVDE